jgi:hypothetical protein
VAVGFLRRSVSRGSIHRTSQARALSTRVSESTLCPLGQSKKAIGRESQIGPCVATHPVDYRQACCFRKRLAPSRQRNGTTGKRKRISASHAETKQGTRPEQDHSQIEGARSNSWAECRDEKGPASGREGGLSLDIPFYRTCLIDAPPEVKDSAFRTDFTERMYIDCSDGMGATGSYSWPPSVACSPGDSKKNVLVPRFFLPFSLLDVPYINRGLSSRFLSQLGIFPRD